MTTTTTKLISADNFEVRNLKGLKLRIANNQYMPLSGWGIYDKSADAYVRFPSSRIKVVGKNIFFDAPYSLSLKKFAMQACEQGIFEGYQTIKI